MRLATSALLTLLLVSAAAAQSTGTFALADSSRLWVDGTSNKSDWSVAAQEVEGRFVISAADQAPEFEEVTIKVTARQMVSGRSTIMDRLMHRTLKVAAHPTIEYAMTEITGAAPGERGGWSLETTGTLTIAGQSQEIAMTVVAVEEEGGWRLTGSRDLLMTDFGMKPPTAMFGALHTADEVTVAFDVLTEPAETP